MIAIACDHGGYDLKEELVCFLQEKNIPYKDMGCYDKVSCDYPEKGRIVAKAITLGECEKGIVICTTGIGISIAANKIKGIRAALCTDVEMARLTRLHNDANILALGSVTVNTIEAIKIVDIFLHTDFSGEERHQQRINQIEN